MLAHELSHVAHRDVLVMTHRVVGRHRRRHAHARRPVRRPRHGGRSNNSGGAPAYLDRAGRQPRGLRRQLRPAPPALALPRAVRRPVGRLPHDEAAGARLGADRRSPAASTPSRRRTCARAARSTRSSSSRPSRGITMQTLTATHPSLEQRLEQLARIQAELGRPTRLTRVGSATRSPAAAARGSQQPRRAVPRPERRDHAGDRRRAARRPARGRSATGRRPGAAFAQTQDEITRAARRRPRGPGGRRSAADEYGFTWLVVDGDPTDTGRSLHRPARRQHHRWRTQGFASGLLCSMVTFAGHGGRTRRARLPLQAGHLLRLRPHRPAPARQPDRDQRTRPSRRRAPDGAGPAALARVVECSRTVTPHDELVAFARKARHDLQNPRDGGDPRRAAPTT